MGRKYAVELNGSIVIWNNGKFESEDKEILETIQKQCKAAEKAPVLFLDLDGSMVWGSKGVDPERSWVLSYALLQTLTGGGMKDVAGDRPTWEKLGVKEEKDAVH